MKATVKFEIDVTDFVEDQNLTIPSAEEMLEEIISNAISENLAFPDEFDIKIND